jgi:hypothetical protein
LFREGKDAKLKRAFITGDGETAFDNLQKALSAPSSLFNVDRLYIKTAYLRLKPEDDDERKAEDSGQSSPDNFE